MPDRSYSVRSAFSTNSSASLSLLKRGSFLFIMLHFPLVHAPGADLPDESFAAPRPKREHNENSATLSGPADCLEALLGFRVQRIRNDGDWPVKYALDLRRRNAMLLALGPVASSQSNPATCIRLSTVTLLLSVRFCTAIRQYLRLYCARTGVKLTAAIAGYQIIAPGRG